MSEQTDGGTRERTDEQAGEHAAARTDERASGLTDLASGRDRPSQSGVPAGPSASRAEGSNKCSAASLAAKTVPAKLGEVDSFLSHSWQVCGARLPTHGLSQTKTHVQRHMCHGVCVYVFVFISVSVLSVSVSFTNIKHWLAQGHLSYGYVHADGSPSCVCPSCWQDEEVVPGAKYKCIAQWARRHERATGKQPTLWLVRRTYTEL